MITLWGPSSSGKTALLSYLYLSSQKVKNSQKVRTDWQIFPTPASVDEIIRQSQKILRANEFPVATEPGKNPDISYDFTNKVTGQKTWMGTKDRAGVLSESMDPELIASLVAAEGIVLLLDYGRGDRETEVIEALTQMNVAFSKANNTTGKSDPRPLAVCLSKVDQLLKHPEDLKRLADREGQEKFVREHLSEQIVGWIEQFHSNVRFFPVSSVGLRLSFGRIARSVFFDEKMVLRVGSDEEATPINIVEPFVWIFENLAANSKGSAPAAVAP